MTIIEFFDTIAIHNALSTLLLAPDRLILFGSNSLEMYAFSHRLQKLIAARGLPTKVQVMHAGTKSYSALVKKLETLLLTYDDCAFDLTGGQTEILVAMGALSQKYGVPMHTVDPARGTLSLLTAPTPYPAPRKVQLSIAENIALYGGKVRATFVPPLHTSDFWEDVLAVWSVCKQDCQGWNTAISALHAFCTLENLYVELQMETVSRKLSPQKADTLRRIIYALQKTGCLTGYREKGAYISFRCKSATVQHALSKEGAVLELYTYYAAFVLQNRKKNIFTAAETGVVIDWETAPSSYLRDDVKNEIDVFLMQGIVPVFISCKNGYVDTDELYKLSVVADRFGGPYAKKAIVLTRHVPDASFLNRAKELGIKVMQNTHNLSPAMFAEKLADSAVK